MNSKDLQTLEVARRAPSLAWLIIIGCLLVLLLAILLPRPEKESPGVPGSIGPQASPGTQYSNSARRNSRFGHRPDSRAALSAQEIVAGKLRQFARIRRETVRAM